MTNGIVSAREIPFTANPEGGLSVDTPAEVILYVAADKEERFRVLVPINMVVKPMRRRGLYPSGIPSGSIQPGQYQQPYGYYNSAYQQRVASQAGYGYPAYGYQSATAYPYSYGAQPAYSYPYGSQAAYSYQSTNPYGYYQSGYPTSYQSAYTAQQPIYSRQSYQQQYGTPPTSVYSAQTYPYPTAYNANNYDQYSRYGKPYNNQWYQQRYGYNPNNPNAYQDGVKQQVGN